jgi:uncharacterized protein YndB with AHSA1/START domain
LVGAKSPGDSVARCEAEVRVGGCYRYVLRCNTGAEFAFSGKYTEVTPHSRLVYTQVFEPTASGANPGDAEIMITVTFDEQDGRTHLVEHVLCPSQELRDMILASGMERGLRLTLDELDELVRAMC